MLRLRESPLALGSMGALLVVAGVVLGNTGEQTRTGSQGAASLLFVLGWLVVTYAMAQHRRPQEQAALWVSAAAIVISVKLMKSQMKQGQKPHLVLPVAFAVGWLIFGGMASFHLPGWGRLVGVVGALLVLASMLYALPWQRRNCVVDGPGMPLFVLGWVLVVGSRAAA